MSKSVSRASRWLLGAAVYLTGWYLEGDVGMALQAGAVCLLLAAAFLSALSGGVFRTRISLVEQLFGVVFGFALLVAIVTANFLSLLYAGMFLMVVVAVALLIRHEEAAHLPGVFRGAYIALLATLLLVEPGELFGSLSGKVEHGIGLVRYQPLGMHPNLAGLVYGGGVLLFIQHYLAVPKTSQKVFAASMAFLCLFVLLAASARASLLALAVSGLVGMAGIAIGGSVKARLVLLVALAIGIGVALFKLDDILNYFTLILDLESDTRGLDSGATGRTDIWLDGISLVFSDLILMVTGRGLRAALPEIIGFPVESSYINLALEHGVVLGAFMVIVFYKTAWKAVRQGVSQSQSGDYEILLFGLMLVFILFQSIFNRYLIAVGNPYSLFVFFLILGLNLSATRSARLGCKKNNCTKHF